MQDEIARTLRELNVAGLRKLVDTVRPPRGASTEEIDQRLRALIDALRDDEERREEVRQGVWRIATESRLVHALAESGILADVGFFAELQRRLGARILPRQPHPDDVRRYIEAIFRKGWDWEWIDAASPELWEELVLLLLGPHDSSGCHDRDVLGALQGLAQRIGGLGIDEELNAKLYEVEDYESPFLDLTIHTHDFLENHRLDKGTEASFRLLMEKIEECRGIILFLRDNQGVYGTSLRLTALSRRLLQQLDRLELLSHLVRPQSAKDLAATMVRIFRTLVEATQNAHSIRRLIRESGDLVAFEITEQSARKGQTYITDSRSGYWAFLRAAIRGGGIVVVFAVFKILLAKLPVSLAAEALIFGLNYAVCFIVLYLTGSILATKQPAVLASAIAKKIDRAENRKSAIEGVADVITLAWRSQFVAFLGNLICALPLAWLVGFLLTEFAGVTLVDDVKAGKLLASVHPWESLALFYAGIAGVFLFLAGVITGAVENHVIYADFERRIAVHPRLAFLGAGRERLARFVRKNLSMLVGNTALGFFLGSAGTIGVILGLPFDIRHIAFSSAHVGLSVFSAPELLTLELGIAVAIGISAIGFFNFLVSFMLTLSMGLESRQVTFAQTRDLIIVLLARLFARPWEWFFPPRTRRYSLPEDVEPADPVEPGRQDELTEDDAA